MSSSKKAGKANVNASSFFDLKAELAKHEDAFAKSKLVGKGRVEPIVGGAKKDKDKKPAVWARQNKGVKDRARRDAELEQVSKPTLESARAALERKAQIYEKLQRGKGGGLSEKQREALLVDFDDRDEGDSSDDPDRDESLVVPRLPGTEADDPDDPIIEYEDEFGRIRTARRSDVPRDRLPEPSSADVPADDDPDVIYGRATHFPVYEPTAEKRAEVAQALAEAESSPFARYDASKDNRATGAGHYQFSKDEEARAQQMEELKQARVETVIARARLDAEDVAGSLRDAVLDERGKKTTSRAVEKRRKELEDRRQMLKAKRRKMLGIVDDDHTGDAEQFLASLEKDLLSAPTAV